MKIWIKIDKIEEYIENDYNIRVLMKTHSIDVYNQIIPFIARTCLADLESYIHNKE